MTELEEERRADLFFAAYEYVCRQAEMVAWLFESGNRNAAIRITQAVHNFLRQFPRVVREDLLESFMMTRFLHRKELRRAAHRELPSVSPPW